MKSVKKNKEMRRMLGLAALVVVTLSLLGGTLAKYTQKAEYTDNARVAKFDVSTTGDDSKMFNARGMFDDWKGTAPTFTTNDGKYLPQAPQAETDVFSSSSDNVLAPGTSGYAIVNITNSDQSEVTVKYNVDFTSTVTGNANIPLEYAYAISNDNTVAPTTISNWSAALPGAGVITGTMPADVTKTHQVYVFWRWAFERGTTDSEKTTNNSSDTELGRTGTDKVEIKADVTMEQVD